MNFRFLTNLSHHFLSYTLNERYFHASLDDVLVNAATVELEKVTIGILQLIHAHYFGVRFERAQKRVHETGQTIWVGRRFVHVYDLKNVLFLFVRVGAVNN